MSRLDRFKRAQQSEPGGFESALRELRAGHKQSHWIWYVFPQLSGLGASSSSIRYGIGGVDEAVEYLGDPLLAANLQTATTTVLDQLRRGVPIERLMGSQIDVLKLISSLTLFQRVASRLPPSGDGEKPRALALAAEEVLSAAEAQGYARCTYTLGQLR